MSKDKRSVAERIIDRYTYIFYPYNHNWLKCIKWDKYFCKCLDEVELKLVVQLYNCLMDKDIQFHVLFDNSQKNPFYDDMNIDAPLPKISRKICEFAQPDGLTLYKPYIKPKKVIIDDLFRKDYDVAITYSTLCLLLFNRKVERKKLFEHCFLCSPFMFANYLFDLCSFIKNSKSIDCNFYKRHLILISDVLKCFSEEKNLPDWDPFDQMREDDFTGNYKCRDSFPAQQDKLKKKLCIYDGKDLKSLI